MILRAFNHQITEKKNYTKFSTKTFSLKSDFTLTLGYLNPALNNMALTLDEERLWWRDLHALSAKWCTNWRIDLLSWFTGYTMEGLILAIHDSSFNYKKYFENKPDRELTNYHGVCCPIRDKLLSKPHRPRNKGNSKQWKQTFRRNFFTYFFLQKRG